MLLKILRSLARELFPRKHARASGVEPNQSGRENNEENKGEDPWTLEEYKIIQAKVDKIGDFSHKVKGWSLTITAGIVAGTASTDVPAWFALGAIVTTFLFWLGDKQQQRLKTILMKRATAIEAYYRKANASKVSRELRSPELAYSIYSEAYLQKRSKFKLWPPSLNRKGIGHLLSHDRDWLVARYDGVFYLGQLAFSVGTAVLLYYTTKTPLKSEMQRNMRQNLASMTNSALWTGLVQTIVNPLTNQTVINSYFQITNVLPAIQLTLAPTITITNIIVVSNMPSQIDSPLP